LPPPDYIHNSYRLKIFSQHEVDHDPRTRALKAAGKLRRCTQAYEVDLDGEHQILVVSRSGLRLQGTGWGYLREVSTLVWLRACVNQWMKGNPLPRREMPAPTFGPENFIF